MNKTAKILVWVVVIVLVIWGITSISKGGSNTIKIGFMGPLTGDTADIGQNAQAAVSIAVDEVNAAGGVLGKKLEECRIAVRNVRKDFNNLLRDAKKDKEISENFFSRLSD